MKYIIIMLVAIISNVASAESNFRIKLNFDHLKIDNSGGSVEFGDSETEGTPISLEFDFDMLTKFQATTTIQDSCNGTLSGSSPLEFGLNITFYAQANLGCVSVVTLEFPTPVKYISHTRLSGAPLDLLGILEPVEIDYRSGAVPFSTTWVMRVQQNPMSSLQTSTIDSLKFEAQNQAEYDYFIGN